jgi:DinB superfamily
MTKEILAQFDSTTKEFCALAKAIPFEKLHVAPAPGEWPPSYAIHHLADLDAQFATRFLNMLVAENPTIVSFDEESAPLALDYEHRNAAVSLALIEASAAFLVDVLNQVSPDAWSRTAVHPAKGKLSMSELLEVTTNHRISHLDQIRQ